jgi:hypothetical protein
MEAVFGRKHHDEEFAAGIAAYMLSNGGMKKRAAAMRKAIYRAKRDLETL